MNKNKHNIEPVKLEVGVMYVQSPDGSCECFYTIVHIENGVALGRKMSAPEILHNGQKLLKYELFVASDGLPYGYHNHISSRLQTIKPNFNKVEL
jgi:hypothetical protein